MNIHLIEKDKRFRQHDKATHAWESGFWSVSTGVAEDLVGGNIYFHRNQSSPSYFGGTITGYTVVTEGEWEGRVIFQFTATAEHKGVRTTRDGWGMEKKIVE